MAKSEKQNPNWLMPNGEIRKTKSKLADAKWRHPNDDIRMTRSTETGVVHDS
jgi:hypothetical protein